MSPSRTALVGGVDVHLDHYVDGARVGSATTFEDRSPIDWSLLLGEVARGDADTAAAALAAAAAAAPRWAALGVEGRAVILHRLADLIDERTEELAIVECLDMAMLHESLRARVIGRGARNFRAYADLARAYEPRRWSSNGTDNTVLRMPAGPTVVITPWNAPFMLSTWKTAPALAAGNTVVLKPAEWSPLSCSLLCDLAEEAGMPPGVLNVVQGIGAEVGAALVADLRVRRISFTGSPATGVAIGVEAARNLVPFTAELGGKGPLLVFADADLDAAASTAARMYDDAGQVCLAGTRLLVESTVHDAFFERFREATDAHVLGDPRDAATTVSPLIHPDHLARVEGFVERARAAGDEIAFGGRRWKDDALWYEPTLVLPRSNDAEIVQAEVFGPVLTLQRFADEDEAVALANSTRYGLSAMVFTTDAARAARCSEAIRAGTVWTNCFLVRDLTAPFGGCGISGIGREGGDYALDFYSELKTAQVKEGTTHG
ncbi:MAG TPA: aldehyde dehydrogenase family protein [Acidimicrobiales bacterium]|nr:aldehyde dehydrogenase family protein [Acidimicrobiales bacterium]